MTVTYSIRWSSFDQTTSKHFSCGHCGVLASAMYHARGDRIPSDIRGSQYQDEIHLFICNACGYPTTFNSARYQHPPPRENSVTLKKTSKPIESIFREGEFCLNSGRYMAACLVFRGLLMHLAVEHGAKEGQKFEVYINWFESEGHIPVKTKDLVDRIRKAGNQATHKLEEITKEQAQDSYELSKFLLNCFYELGV